MTTIIRKQDLARWKTLGSELQRGGLPEVGVCHPKFGYRVSIGVERVGEAMRPTRYSLGRDKLVAQYRARALWMTWFDKVIEAHENGTPPVMPLTAREDAWKIADQQLGLPALLAARMNGDELVKFTTPGFALGVMRESSAPVVPNRQAPKPAARMLHSAADEWTTHLERRLKAGDLSDSYYERAKSTVKNLKRAAADVVLADVGRSDLEGIRLWYSARMSKPKSEGGITYGTAKTELTQLRSFLRWCDEGGYWSEVKGWVKAMTPAQTSAAEDDRDEDDRHKTYTMAQLAKLWLACSTPNQKTFFLAGLNCAFGQTEIATLRRRHFKREGDAVLIKRKRHKKTRNAPAVYGEWTLWPETWRVFAKRMKLTSQDKRENPKGLAFQTSGNLPLVRRLECVDEIGDCFKRLCKAAEVEHLGFYALRRTAIDLIDGIAGETVADLMACHRPRSITRRHYANRKWPKLHRALLILRKQFVRAVREANQHNLESERIPSST